MGRTALFFTAVTLCIALSASVPISSDKTEISKNEAAVALKNQLLTRYKALLQKRNALAACIEQSSQPDECLSGIDLGNLTSIEKLTDIIKRVSQLRLEIPQAGQVSYSNPLGPLGLLEQREVAEGVSSILRGLVAIELGAVIGAETIVSGVLDIALLQGVIGIPKIILGLVDIELGVLLGATSIVDGVLSIAGGAIGDILGGVNSGLINIELGVINGVLSVLNGVVSIELGVLAGVGSILDGVLTILRLQIPQGLAKVLLALVDIEAGVALGVDNVAFAAVDIVNGVLTGAGSIVGGVLDVVGGVVQGVGEGIL